MLQLVLRQSKELRSHKDVTPHILSVPFNNKMFAGVFGCRKPETVMTELTTTRPAFRSFNSRRSVLYFIREKEYVIWARTHTRDICMRRDAGKLFAPRRFTTPAQISLGGNRKFRLSADVAPLSVNLSHSALPHWLIDSTTWL